MRRMHSAALRILVTGGTFDKDYHELEGRLHFRETHVQEMLQLGRCKLAVEVETLMLIDSLEMTDDDRARILDACRSAPEERIVITHGTDTMELTARAIGSAGLAKTMSTRGSVVPEETSNSLCLVCIQVGALNQSCLP